MGLRKSNIHPSFYITLAVGILIVPLKWLISWLLAAFLHELFHYIALRMCGCSVYGVEIGAVGAVIQADITSHPKMLFCALCGPLAGLLLLLLLPYTPRLALCGFFQSVFNLIPIFPLDGARALRSLLAILFPERIAVGISRGIGLSVMGLMVGLAIYAAVVLRLGIMPLMIVTLLMVKNKIILANRGVNEYNSGIDYK